MVEVTQADRQRMVLYENSRPVGLLPAFAKAILAGEHDSDYRIQAFALHREAAIEEAAKDEAAVERVARAICCPNGYCQAEEATPRYRCAALEDEREARAAIRALANPKDSING